MSEIVLPENEDGQEQELKYKATELDEKKFFLMYHLNWAPSEVDGLSEDRIDWLIARFIGQKKVEKEMFQSMQIAQQLGDLKGPPDLRVT